MCLVSTRNKMIMKRYGMVSGGNLGEGDSDTQDSGSGGNGSNSNSDDDEEDDEEQNEEKEGDPNPQDPSTTENKPTTIIHDLTKSDLIDLRRIIYLTIMSSATFEECAASKSPDLGIRTGKYDP